MADPKTHPTGESVTAFIAGVQHDRRRADAKLLLPIMRRVTGKRPLMWGPSIIGYGKYHYVYESGREGDWPITGFSPRKAAMTIYVMPGFKPFTAQLKKLGKHKTSSSCLYVNRLDDIDLDILEYILAQSVNIMREKYKTS